MNFFNMNFDMYTVLQLFTKVVIVFLILPIHEFAHAWAAHKMGDDTAAYMGRLTLNPLSHIDPIGAVCLVLTGFGWAKPVPINPTKFRKPRFGTSVTAAAGPLSNLIVAFIALVVYRVLACTEFIAQGGDMTYFLMYMLSFFVQVNIGLAIFNLIPIPPLDGSKIVQYFTSAKFDRMMAQYSQYISIGFMIIVLSGILSRPLGWIDGKILDFFWFITSFIPSLMGVG